jgi:hypothetical protein
MSRVFSLAFSKKLASETDLMSVVPSAVLVAGDVGNSHLETK